MRWRFWSGLRSRHKVIAKVAVVALAASVTTLPSIGSAAAAGVLPVKSSLLGSDGKNYWVQNHLVSNELQKEHDGLRGRRPEYLIVWAGDSNVADTVIPDIKNLPGSLSNTIDHVRNALPGPDFMAVIDATKGSPSYGKVVNTATVGPLVENEPHHMQYVWHKGEKIYAGGLFSAATYVFDVSRLPALTLSGISLPTATACGSVPDAYWVLKDGTAYATYMGGPVAPGPCRYSHGEVRTGNGFGGTPGEVVRFGTHGQDLVQAPAAVEHSENFKNWCDNLPQVGPSSCANPHGIQLREDLHTMVTSDYAEPRNIILDPIKAPTPFLRRSSIRTWDISDLSHPRVKSVSFLQPGPRAVPSDPLHWENRAIMETTVTNLPGHKGAFAESMQGGAVYYTSDITSAHPYWREVLDDWAGDKLLKGGGSGSGDNAGWIQTSPDDKTVYHAIVGRQKGTLGSSDPGTAGGILAIDVSKLVAAGDHAQCEIKTLKDARDGGGRDCPTIRSTVTINPNTPAGGPHWGALDNLQLGHDGYYHETDQPRRIASANYFVARTGLDGDHKVCMTNIDKDGKLSLDTSFRDEITEQPCISFNRKNWPHGAFGDAKPHSMLFVTADDDIK